MPITKGAIRKQRADKKRAVVNSRIRDGVREEVAKMRKKPSQANLNKAFEALDVAAKKKVIHGNKAARIKARLSRLVKKK